MFLRPPPPPPGRPQRFATATAYAATAAMWAPSEAAPSNLGVWLGAVDVEE
jgi:hypothetical protein